MACGATEGTRITFPMAVAGVAPTSPTQTGWTVALTSAEVHLSAARFYTGKVLISRRFDPWSLIISSAWAHPGHYQEGQALGENLSHLDADLLGGEVDWGTATAVTGEYGSMQLTYAGALTLKGTATKGSEHFTFDTGGSLPKAKIEGIKFDQVIGAAKKGRVVVTLNLATLLERVDFDKAGTVDAAGILKFDPTSEAYNGFARGILDTGTYLVEWKETQ